MDDKENFITVTHNSGSSDVTPEPEMYGEKTDILPEPAEDITSETDAPAETAESYAHEQISEVNSAAEELQAAPPTPPQNQPQVQYDAFMKQPIGFEELERQQTASEEYLAEKKKHHKPKHTRSEKVIVIFLALIFIVTLVLSIVAMCSDISRSDEVFQNYTPPAAGSDVVVYQNSKPTSQDAEDYLGEDGKYTSEGVAMLVRPSIVEIYTYSDAQQDTLLGTGSGIVLSEDGYTVTNAHVLQSDGYHNIITTDGQECTAKIVGRDAKTDIAVLKVSDIELQPAVLGDSDEVMVGEQVMAIGNPAGLSGSVTDGIVSAVNRNIRADSTGFEMNCIQTNAAISPGNSGGALVNMYGQVIGITSSKYVSSSYEGLGFAITINDAMPIIEELIGQGYISGRFRIGIQFIEMTTEDRIFTIEQELGFELPDDFKGIYIAEVSDDCDIANTELQPGDFITAINGKTVTCYDDFYDTISSMYAAGDYVPATCARFDDAGEVSYFEIEFMLMEDTSGDY